MRPLASATVTMLYNSALFLLIALFGIGALAVFGSDRVVALAVAAGFLLLYVALAARISQRPLLRQIDSAVPAPEDAARLTTSRQVGWLALLGAALHLPVVFASLAAMALLAEEVGRELDAGISMGWSCIGVMVGFFGGGAYQMAMMARALKRQENGRGIDLYEELWPLRKLPIAGQGRPRARFYYLSHGEKETTQGHKAVEEADFIEPGLGVFWSVGLGLGVLGASALPGDSSLANGVRIAVGSALLVGSAAVIADWHGLLSRLAGGKWGSRLGRVHTTLAALAGVASAARGIVQLIG